MAIQVSRVAALAMKRGKRVDGTGSGPFRVILKCRPATYAVKTPQPRIGGCPYSLELDSAWGHLKYFFASICIVCGSWKK
jgi:hypothetical protein